MKNNLVLWAIGGIVIIVVAIGAVMAIGKQPASAPTADSTSTNDQSKDTSTPDDHSSASQTVTITYTDSGFSPDSYMVKASGTVTVVNNSSHDLQFSSDNHPTHTKETELNMDILKPGKSGSFTVTKVGTWGFHNHLRDQDTGSLMVM